MMHGPKIHLDGLLITYNQSQVEKTVTERESSNVLQNIQFQITVKEGAVNGNVERNVYHEPVCN